jgi:acetyl esterase/lipase
MKIDTVQLSDKSRLTSYIYDAPQKYHAAYRCPAIIFCPGGGFSHLSPREAEPLALRFAGEGYSVFVLEYPVGEEGVEYPKALRSLALSLRYVRENAPQFYINPKQIAVGGFSAGGHVAASLAVGWNNPALDLGSPENRELIRPDAAILCYPLIDPLIYRGYWETGPSTQERDSRNGVLRRMLGPGEYTQEQKDAIALQKQVHPGVCPCFIWQTADDTAVYVDNTLLFAQALAKNKVPFDVHIFRKGVHGLALATALTAPEGKAEQINPAAAQWVGLCLNWLNDIFQDNC